MRRPGRAPAEAVIEADMAWSGTVCAADPDRALDVVLRSAGPAGLAGAADLAFRRTGDNGSTNRVRGGRPGGADGAAGVVRDPGCRRFIVVTSPSAM
ncbi:hypothetical protein [Streptomyces sp. C11-1]|uniref:hypothetical protein n=1 Tax=Streptomyces sp. C11-1 TaxID=3444503 RepID=UPI0037DA2662